MTRHRPIPPDVLERFGNLPDHVYHGGGEHSSSCPQCGGARGGRDPSDRFRFWEREAGQACNFWCRRCGFDGFTDDNKEDYKPSPEKIAEIEETRQREAEKEERRLRAKIEAIREEAYWRGFHEAMDDQQRELWHRQGIIDYFIDLYKLGYVERHTYYHNGERLHSPAMTIPHYGDEWKLTNVQYRLTQPADGAGKYRQTAGLPASMFRTEPGEELKGPALLVEGAKKAIVCYEHLGVKPLGFRMNIVGVPSKTPGENILGELDGCEPVYIGLDPDAYDTRNSAATRMGRKLGDRVRFVHFPDKPDDLIVEYGLSGDDLKKYLRNATRTV